MTKKSFSKRNRILIKKKFFDCQESSQTVDKRILCLPRPIKDHFSPKPKHNLTVYA